MARNCQIDRAREAKQTLLKGVESGVPLQVAQVETSSIGRVFQGLVQAARITRHYLSKKFIPHDDRMYYAIVALINARKGKPDWRY